jgi:hypothetical protein
MNDTWRTSTYSGSQGGNCVQAGSWRKSRHSAVGNCVEAGAGPGVVGVRDTKDKGRGPVLEFSPVAWQAFTATLA